MEIRQTVNLRKLAGALEDALDCLGPQGGGGMPPSALRGLPPLALVEQCLELCRPNVAAAAVPVRTIHHLSFTGGTLISKCLAAMPNVLVLNEIDPLSTMTLTVGKFAFTPTDMIALLRQADPGVSEDLLVRVFLQDIGFLRHELAATGKRLVLRDHSHSQFLTGRQVARRPTLLAMVQSRFPTLSVVTVRHPLDSFLALQEFKVKSQPLWPPTIEEYCRRYLAFLDAHEGVPVFRYEDFVCEPQAVMERVCQALGLVFSGRFVDTFDTFQFSGDSGRSGAVIAPRERRKFDDGLIQAAADSASFQALAGRLGYAETPSPDTPPA